MIFFQTTRRMKPFVRGTMLVIGAVTLTACMTTTDDTIGSRLAQPPAGTPPVKPIEAGDIAIVGQEVAHSLMDLPAIADATTPPMVQFTGVTSIIDKPVDTDPYTNLFRDRLILLTREKLRFVERTLPPLVTAKSRKSESSSPGSGSEPDYQILAELRGHFEDDLYKIQVQFVDLRTGEILFDGLYHIRKEAPTEPSDETPSPSAQNTTSSSAETGSLP